MSESFSVGLMVLLASGVSNGCFALPMKYTRAWKWENTWLLFTTLALVVIPCLLAVALVPNLGAVYQSGPLSDLAPGFIFGFLWGLAQATFGLAIAAVGIAMAFAIVLGMSGVLGSLIPMAVLHPQDLAGPRGLLLMISAAILCFGLVLYAKAARQRELDAGGSTGGGSGFGKGLALCIFTGALGGMINLGFAFSGRLSERAMSLGASAQAATFAVWVVVLIGGYLPNLAYCGYLLGRNRTAGCFAQSTGRESLLCLFMALLWLGGTQGYGLGAATMGSYGTSIGYAFYIIALTLASTTVGILTGEWKAASRPTFRRMQVGLAVILVSVLVLSATGLIQ